MFGSRLLLVLLLACLTVGASASPVSRLPSPGKWKDPLAFPAPASSSERKALLDQAHRATQTVPADIKKSIAASKAKIDQQVLTERSQALHQLGIKADGVGYLTILVSASVPQGMLNGYAQSAMWAGGVIVFRGVDPKHDIPWFITHVMHALVRPGASPSITLDPRVFSAYGVDSVPAIVYSTARAWTRSAPNRWSRRSSARRSGAAIFKPLTPTPAAVEWRRSRHWNITTACRPTRPATGR